MNVENLKKMADYVVTIDKEKILMNRFRVTDKKNIECDSVGCVIGHCTVLDRENIIKNYLDENYVILFHKWSLNFTGLRGNEWDWCFGASWYKVDNTPIGASKRINYLLEHGLPKNWYEQMIGEEPLCY